MTKSSRLPNGESVVIESEQLPNCILASSNRFADLRPFCDNIYDSDKTKWGSILPFEFPQNATRQIEEAFLRKFFTEVDIHMQGGAHGVGAGFRFLKQAWYSLALRNLYEGIPGIAEKWMEEHNCLLEDPAMRGHLCEPEVTPETFFSPREIKRHSRKLLAFVVPAIQAQAKARHEQPIPSTGGQQPMTNVVPESDAGEGEVRSTASVVPEPQDTANRSLPFTSVPPATGQYAAPPSSYQGATNQRPTQREPRDFTPGHGQYTQQITSRKHDSQNGSSSGARPLVNARRQSEKHHQFFDNMRPSQGGLNSGTSSFFAPVPGPVTAASSSTQFPHYGTPPGQSYPPQTFKTSQQHAFSPYPPPSGPVSQDVLESTAFNNTPRQQLSQPRHFSNHSDNERLSNRTRNTSFNEVSNTSGDARRTSFGSRGGGLRGQHRGGRGRGGRGRVFSHGTGPTSEEQSAMSQQSSDYYSFTGYNLGKRHSSAYQENTWRSSSEHPQVENMLPHRVLSGPEQYPSFQDYQGPTGPRLLPPFIFPHGPAVKHQGPTTLHRPFQTDVTQHSLEPPDVEVGKTYIGADAFHVKSLVVFNIPAAATEIEVATMFAHTCDVDVSNVFFPPRTNAHLGFPDKIAIVQFQNHHVARRVLDLREVDLYGRPLHIEVPRRYLDENHPAFGKHPIPTDRNQRVHGMPHQDINLWFHEAANNSVQPFRHNVQMRAGASFVLSSEASYTSYMPSTPFHPAKREQALSVVQSVNATSVNSGPNTPKKQQSKNGKKKKNNYKTPLASEVEGVDTIGPDKITINETPVKPPKQRRQGLSASVSNDPPLAPEQAQPSNDLSTSGGAKESKSLQSPGTSIDNSDDAAVAKSRPWHETPSKPEHREPERQFSQEGLIVSKDALAGEPTSVLRTPSVAEPTSTSRVSPPTEPTSDRPHVSHSGVGSDTTPKASPRSQLPVQASNELNPSPDRAAVPSSSKRQFLPSQSPPQMSGEIRPASVDRRLSDSDHVDESFHTASASPPDDKQIQIKDVGVHSEPPAHSAQIISTKPTTRSSVNPASSQHGKTIAPATPKRSPKAGTHASGQSPTPSASENKARSVSYTKDDKSLSPTTQHDVSDISDNLKAISATQKSDDCSKEMPVHRVLPATSSLEQVPARSDVSDSRSKEKLTAPTKQHVASDSSTLPTPAAADHDAHTTPAPSKVLALPHSPGNSSSKSKTPAKKGPSQTESLSTFGKKQQKQKKSNKGKGTLRGKPLDSGSTSGLSDGINSRDGGFATLVSTANEPATRKEASSLKATTRLDSSANTDFNSDETKSAVSRQESPGKGGILGGLSRMGSYFSTASSPSVSGHEMMPQDAMPDGELISSKAPPAQAPITSSNEDDLVDNASIASDLGGQHDSGMFYNTQGSLSTSTLGGTDARRSRKKKRNRDRKSKKQDADQTGVSSTTCAEGDVDGDLVSLNVISGTREDAMSETRDPESESRSDESSTTMGRPTPPVSPKRLSESKRRRVENRMNGTEHIITTPAPRNRRIKRKSYSRSAFSATALSTQDATPPTPAQAVSETEIDQQTRILRVYQIANSDDDEDNSQQTRPRVLMLSHGENEGNRSYLSLTADDEGGRYKFIHFDQDGDDGNDQVVLTSDRITAMSLPEAPIGRISEVDSEDESTK